MILKDLVSKMCVYDKIKVYYDYGLVATGLITVLELVSDAELSKLLMNEVLTIGVYGSNKVVQFPYIRVRIKG